MVLPQRSVVVKNELKPPRATQAGFKMLKRGAIACEPEPEDLSHGAGWNAPHVGKDTDGPRAVEAVLSVGIRLF